MVQTRSRYRFGIWSQALLLGLFGAVLLSGCSLPTFRVVPASARTDPVPRASSVSNEVKGNVEPRRYVDLSVYEAGRVETIMVKEGDRVEKGAVLMRLDSYDRYASEKAAAEVERISAQQALDELYRQAPTALADAEAALTQAQKEQALTEDSLMSLQRSKDASRIAQAKANLLLAEKRMNDTKENLRKAQQRYNNRHNPIWLFVSRHDFELLLTVKEKTAAYAERRYWDAKQKYEDLLKPVDEIDLALAQAKLAMANANLRQAERQRSKWLNGPDPDQLAAAQARLKAAEARLVSSQAAMQAAEIIAPFSGMVARLDIKQGEQAQPGVPLVVVADLNDWVVVVQELGEQDVVGLHPGQELRLDLDAYPQTKLSGTVESISQYYTVDNTDVFYKAKIGLQPVDLLLRWGMTARIK
jgi:HlyD family secretion protein